MTSSHLTSNLICFLYHELLLPWERELNKKSAPTFEKIRNLIPPELTIESSKKPDQMSMFQKNWLQRKDQFLVVVQGGNKQYNLIRYLRNSFAHGDIAYCQRNKVRMVKIDHTYKNEVKLFGQISEANLKILLKAISSQMKF